MASVTRNPRPLFVTSLPPAADGMEIYYRADNTNGVIWHLRARSVANGGSATYPWEFVGGGALYSQTATDASAVLVASTWSGINGADPSVTATLVGEYMVTNRLTFSINAATTVITGLKIGTTEAVGTDNSSAYQTTVSGNFYSVQSTDMRGVAASSVISQRYWSGGGTFTRYRASVSITPIRVG